MWRVFLLAWGLTMAAQEASAGAFLEAPGEGQIILTSRFGDSLRSFDANGRIIPVAAYRKFELTALGEYGATDWLTLMLQPSLDAMRSGNAAFTGLGMTEIGARARLLAFDQGIVSAQAMVRVPGATSKSNILLDGMRAPEVDVRLLAGRNFDIANMSAFVSAEAGYRTRGDGWPNEWRVDLTLGVLPAKNWMVLVQSFSAVSDGKGRVWPRSQSHKLQLSAVYALNAHWSVQAGVFGHLAGRNMAAEQGALLGLWYRF